MASELEVRIPNIGDFEDVEIVEVLVSESDRVEAEESLVTLESDKATMEIPAPMAGTVLKLALAVGDRVSEGSLVLRMRVEEGAAAPAPEADAPESADAEPASASPPAAIARAASARPSKRTNFATPATNTYISTLGTESPSWYVTNTVCVRSPSVALSAPRAGSAAGSAEEEEQ